MSDIEAKAVKKIGRGFMSVLKAVGEGINTMAETAERRGQARSAIEAQIEEFNQEFWPWISGNQLALIEKSELDRLRALDKPVEPTPITRTRPRKCSATTGFWDCEDPDCVFHQTEKNRRGVGTPTRNFMS